METDKEFMEVFESVMQRLQDAGMIIGWSDVDQTGDDRRLVPHWNENYNKPLGGESAFKGLTSILADICPEAPLSENEQAIIQIMRSEMDDEKDT